MRICLVILLLLASGCARLPAKHASEAMRLAKERPVLKDDLDFRTFAHSLEEHVKILRAKPEGEMIFGPMRLTRTQYIGALERLIDGAKADPSGQALRNMLERDFDLYEVYGREKWSEIFMTSYFEPVIEGSLKKTPSHSQPLYGIPKDLVEVDLGAFAEQRAELKGAKSVRGRLVSGAGGLPRVLPYPPRAEIDKTDGLKGLAEELYWVDPVDAFMLEVQGSGVVRLGNGREFNVGYASQNGHPYVPIGKFLFDKIPREKMTLQTLEKYLHSVSPEEARRTMDLNPSHVFFRKIEGAGVTTLGAQVTAGRSVATDASFFPKGALAFLEFDEPVFTDASSTEAASWRKTSRYVLDQDTGGAIKGPDRLDLFWGRGPQAKQAAGVIKHKARLWYFVPRLSR